MEPDKAEVKRNPDGTIAPGSAALNPAGRPKGQTLKEFARQWYMSMSDEEKKAYIMMVEEKKPGFAWQMGEGNPANNTDITSAGKPIVILSPEITAKNEIDSGTELDS